MLQVRKKELSATFLLNLLLLFSGIQVNLCLGFGSRDTLKIEKCFFNTNIVVISYSRVSWTKTALIGFD